MGIKGLIFLCTNPKTISRVPLKTFANQRFVIDSPVFMFNWLQNAVCVYDALASEKQNDLLALTNIDSSSNSSPSNSNSSQNSEKINGFSEEFHSHVKNLHSFHYIKKINHQFDFPTNMYQRENEIISVFLLEVLLFLNTLRQHNIFPLFVFDGPPQNDKREKSMVTKEEKEFSQIKTIVAERKLKEAQEKRATLLKNVEIQKRDLISKKEIISQKISLLKQSIQSKKDMIQERQEKLKQLPAEFTKQEEKEINQEISLVENYETYLAFWNEKSESLEKKEKKTEKEIKEIQVQVDDQFKKSSNQQTNIIRPKAYHFRTLQKFLQLLGFPIYHSPYEAEITCTDMINCSFADAICTQDSDALILGDHIVVRDFFSTKTNISSSNLFYSDQFISRIDCLKFREDLGLSKEQMVDFAILLGTDFNPRVFMKEGNTTKLLTDLKKHGDLFTLLEKDSNKYELNVPFEQLKTIRKKFLFVHEKSVKEKDQAQKTHLFSNFNEFKGGFNQFCRAHAKVNFPLAPEQKSQIFKDLLEFSQSRSKDITFLYEQQGSASSNQMINSRVLTKEIKEDLIKQIGFFDFLKQKFLRFFKL